METPLARKQRLAPDGEALEARCVLSRVGPAAGWAEATSATPAQFAPLPRVPSGATDSATVAMASPAGATDRQRPAAHWQSLPAAGASGAPWSGTAAWPGDRSATMLGVMTTANSSWMARGGHSASPTATATAWAWAWANPAGLTVAAAPSGAAPPTTAPASTAAEPAVARTAELAGQPGQGDSPAAAPAATTPPPRLAAATPAARSGDVASTARTEGATLARTAPVASPATPAVAPAPPIAATPAGGGAGVGPEGQGRGAAAAPASAVIIGRDAPGSPAQPAPVGGAPGAGDPRTPAVARPVGGSPRGEALQGGDGRAVDAQVVPSPGRDLGAPAPQFAGVITSLVPAGRATIEAALDQLFEPFDALGPAMTRLTPFRLLTASLTVSVSVLAVEAALRLRRRGDEEAEGGSPDRFPGLPGCPEGARS